MLDLRDNRTRYRVIRGLVKKHGYQPVYAPNGPDIYFAAWIFSILYKTYPLYRWVVEVRDDVVTIVNETLSATLGWRKPISEFDSDGQVIKKIGGSFLERFGLEPAPMDIDQIEERQKDARGGLKVVPGADSGDEWT